ncbi:MAG: hypothetical protein M3Q63_04090 [bacterium]|nr:hypothetical protein [bacterium]
MTNRTDGSEQLNPNNAFESNEPRKGLLEDVELSDAEIAEIITELKGNVDDFVEKEAPVVVEENNTRIAQDPTATPEDVEHASQATAEYKVAVEGARGTALNKLQKLEVADESNLEPSLAASNGVGPSLKDPTLGVTGNSLRAKMGMPENPINEEPEIIHSQGDEGIKTEPVNELINQVDQIMSDISKRIDQQVKGEKAFTHNDRIAMSDELLTFALNLTHKSKDPRFVQLKDALFMMARDMRAGALNETNLGAKAELNRRLARVKSVLALHHDTIKQRISQINNLNNIVETTDTDETLEALAQAVRPQEVVPEAPAQEGSDPILNVSQKEQIPDTEAKPFVPYIPLDHRDKELFYASYGRNPDGTPFETEASPETIEEAPQSFNDYLKKWNQFVQSNDVFKDIPELATLEFDQKVFDSLNNGNRAVLATSRITPLQFENYIYRLAGSKQDKEGRNLLGIYKGAIDEAIIMFEQGGTPIDKSAPETEQPHSEEQPLSKYAQAGIEAGSAAVEEARINREISRARTAAVFGTSTPEVSIQEPVVEQPLPTPEPSTTQPINPESIPARESLKKPTEELVTNFNELLRQIALRETNKLNALIPKDAIKAMVFEITKLSTIDFASPDSFKVTDQALRGIIEGINKLGAVQSKGPMIEDLRSLDAMGKVLYGFNDHIQNTLAKLRESGLPEAEVTAGFTLQLNDALANADKRLEQRYKRAEKDPNTLR